MRKLVVLTKTKEENGTRVTYTIDGVPGEKFVPNGFDRLMIPFPDECLSAPL